MPDATPARVKVAQSLVGALGGLADRPHRAARRRAARGRVGGRASPRSIRRSSGSAVVRVQRSALQRRRAGRRAACCSSRSIARTRAGRGRAGRRAGARCRACSPASPRPGPARDAVLPAAGGRSGCSAAGAASLAVALVAGGRRGDRAVDGCATCASTNGSCSSRRKAASRSGPATTRWRAAKATSRRTRSSSAPSSRSARRTRALAPKSSSRSTTATRSATSRDHPGRWLRLLARKAFYTRRADRPVVCATLDEIPCRVGRCRTCCCCRSRVAGARRLLAQPRAGPTPLLLLGRARRCSSASCSFRRSGFGFP